MNNNEAANKMEKIIAIWKLSQKSSSKKRKLSIVSLCIYNILIGVGVSSLLFWPYSYPQRIKRMNNKSARDCCRLNDCERNLHSCETRDRIKRKWQILKTDDSYILYNGNVLFRVSKGNSTYVPQLRADIPLVIIDYYREMQTKYKRIFE